MQEQDLYELLAQLQAGSIELNEVYEKLKVLPYEEMGYAKLDHHRSMRDNFPEVIYCPGKTTEQIQQIFTRLAQHSTNILATRAEKDVYIALKESIPELQYNESARLMYLKRSILPALGRVAVVTAGTADIPVAEEAALTAEVMGAEVERIYDVGVAGIHRLFSKMQVIDQCQVIIVVAGMEGALASVVGGLTPRPVIAVPTSVGYGASFNGLAALLAMLNTCATGVGVVNIDNGFGAAALAISILKVPR